MQNITAGPGTAASTGATDPGGTASNEIRRLIASNRVEGTAVYNRQGERLGAVHHFMVDKITGQVAYAVMSFGGFLGIGERYHPLPWTVLTYDPGKGAYVVDLDKDTLQGAPSFSHEELQDWGSGEHGTPVDDYFRVAPSWHL